MGFLPWGGANAPATGTSFGEAHGTHVAGIIASVAPDAKIMPLQVSEYGVAYASTVIEAIKYAEDHGAVIANCSWTTEEYNPLLEKVMADSSLLFVVAAGNNGRDVNRYPVYPASFSLDNAVSVTSIDADGRLSYFSNRGQDIDIAAWGRDIKSIMPGGGTDTLSGTSMAAAYVSGAAALAASSGGVSIQEMKLALINSADKVQDLEADIRNGCVLNTKNLAEKSVSRKSELCFIDSLRLRNRKS